MSKAMFDPGELAPEIFPLPTTLYIKHAEEDFGVARANSRTHKQFLRKNHLGKFSKKRRAK